MKNKDLNISFSKNNRPLFLFVVPVLLGLCAFASTAGTMSKLYTAFDGNFLWALSLSFIIYLMTFIGAGFAICMGTIVYKHGFSFPRLLGFLSSLVVGVSAMFVSLWTESSYLTECLKEVNPQYFLAKERVNTLKKEILLMNNEISKVKNSHVEVVSFYDQNSNVLDENTQIALTTIQEAMGKEKIPNLKDEYSQAFENFSNSTSSLVDSKNKSLKDSIDKIEEINGKIIKAERDILINQEIASSVSDGWLNMCEKFNLPIWSLSFAFFGFIEIAGAFGGYLAVSNTIRNTEKKQNKEFTFIDAELIN